MCRPTETSQRERSARRARVVAPPESRGTILWMLLVVMGVLAVPMLWQSPHFSRPTKVVLAVLAAFQTIVALVILALVILWFLAEFSATWLGR